MQRKLYESWNNIPFQISSLCLLMEQDEPFYDIMPFITLWSYEYLLNRKSILDFDLKLSVSVSAPQGSTSLDMMRHKICTPRHGRHYIMRYAT